MKQQTKYQIKKRARRKAIRPGRLKARRQQSQRNGRRLARRLKTLGAAKKLINDGVRIPMLTHEEHVFWLCHGVNFLVSDDETGAWEPLFSEIYEGRLPSSEGVAAKVSQEFNLGSDDPIDALGRVILAWTVSEESAIRIYKHEAERRILLVDPDCDAEAMARLPHNPTVWEIMKEVKKHAL